MSRPRRRDPERGSALLVMLLVLSALIGLGLAALGLTSSNLQVGANIALRTRALYAAEAGIERARAALSRASDAELDALLAGRNPGRGDEAPTGVDAQGRPNGAGALMLDGGTLLRAVRFPPVGLSPDGAPAMGQYTVWIRNDLAELRQGLSRSDRNGSVVVRSQGVALDGRTVVVLETTLARDPGSRQILGDMRCHEGKNGCDDNSSTEDSLVVDAPAP